LPVDIPPTYKGRGVTDVLANPDPLSGAEKTRSQRKAKGSGHLRRAEIIEAASRIFLECGYEGATIRKIADAVGVSSTALYMHFSDKSEILVEICETAFAQLIALNTEISAEDMEPVARVRRMLEVYLDFAFTHPNAYQLVFCFTGAALTPEREAALSALGRRCYDLFLGAVQRIGDAGLLKSADVDAAAQTSWAGTHGLATLLLTRPTFEWADRETLAPMMLDALFTGLVKGG
jgi:AcrR family transcriptional regulator